MTNLAMRIITAVVLLSALLSVLFLLPPVAARLFFALMVGIAAWEWAGFSRPPASWHRFAYVAVIAALALGPAFSAEQVQLADAAIWIGVICWPLVGVLLYFGARPLPRWAVLLAGLFALIPAWYALELTLQNDQGRILILSCLAIVAAADIGAYFTGKSFGRNKLAPAISPGKTIEGLAGGLVAAALVSLGIAVYFGRPAGLALLLGLLAGVLSVIGDLWVSRFKRAAGLKDSGQLLPGHGGALDRIDGVIAALPLFALITLGVQLPGG